MAVTKVSSAFASMPSHLHKAARHVRMSVASGPVHGAVGNAGSALCFSLVCGDTAFDVRILAH